MSGKKSKNCSDSNQYYQSLENIPAWSRKGQHAFNQLLIYFPDFAEHVRATEIDPFYNDKRLPEFFKSLEGYLESKDSD